MTVSELLSGIPACSCGRAHTSPTKTVVIEDGALSRLPAITEGYSHILLVADENTYAACGAEVARILGTRIAAKQIFQTGNALLVPNETAIDAIASHITESVDLIVGVGSGVINDLCKIVAFENGLPYDIVATAPSMDGYASNGAALILGGMKITKNAAVPRAIIADTRVLAAAPADMIRAGYGDIIGKLSCLLDWRLSAVINGEYLCERVWRETYDIACHTVRSADAIRSGSPAAIGKLMEALVAVGILMAYVGNSRPASGSEHHLSHYFEIVGILRGEPYLSHGIDVAYSAIETARLRERLAALDRPRTAPYDPVAAAREIRRIYGALADDVLALQEKVGFYTTDRSKIYEEKWGQIRELLLAYPSASEMQTYVEQIGLDYAGGFRAFYGNEKIADALAYAKDLKDRFTVLWLAYDLLS